MSTRRMKTELSTPPVYIISGYYFHELGVVEVVSFWVVPVVSGIRKFLMLQFTNQCYERKSLLFIGLCD